MGAPQRRPAVAARPRARRARELRRRPGARAWPRTPTTASPRPATSAARRWPPRASPWRPGPERVVAVGEAAPGDSQETVVSPDQAPTVLAVERASARRRLWPWALAAVPIAGLALIAALALGGGDDGGGGGGDDGGVDEHRAPTDAARQTPAIKTSTVGGRPNNIVMANGKAWVVRSGNPRLAVIDAKTAKRESYSPTSAASPSGEAAGFGKLWVINQDAPSLVPIGLKSHRQEGSAVPLPAQGKAVAVAGGEQRDVGRRPRQPGPAAADRPQATAPSPAKTIELPDGLQNIAVGGGAVWIIARRANTVTRLDIASGDAAPDLRRREAVRDRLRPRRRVGDQQRRRHRDADRQRVAEHADHPGRARARRGSPSARAPSGSPTRSPRPSRASTRRPASPSGEPIAVGAQPLRRRHARQRRVGHEPQRRQGPAADACARGRASRRRRPAAPRPRAASASGSGAGARSRSAGRACAGAT